MRGMKYTVDAGLRVEFEVRNPDAIERITGAGGDEWRSHFYALHTFEDVIDHWTYNVVNNGVRDITRLDGWADLDPDDVVVETEYLDSNIERVEA